MFTSLGMFYLCELMNFFRSIQNVLQHTSILKNTMGLSARYSCVCLQHQVPVTFPAASQEMELLTQLWLSSNFRNLLFSNSSLVSFTSLEN